MNLTLTSYTQSKEGTLIMKTIIIAITLLTLAALPVQAQKQTKKAKKPESTAIATIEVNSVKCSMCASTVTDALMEVEEEC